MLNQNSGRHGHEGFKELSAVANSGTLSAKEWLELKQHLLVCEDCREINNQYQLLSRVGMPWLATAYSDAQEIEEWDDSELREKLLARIHRAEQPHGGIESQLTRSPAGWLLGLEVNRWAGLGITACLGIAIAVGAYFLGTRTHAAKDAAGPPLLPEQKLLAERQSSNALAEAQLARIAAVQEQNAKQEQEVARLKAALRALEDHSREQGATDAKTEAQLRAVSEQRDALSAQLQQADQSRQSAKAELASLRAENEREVLRSASLESRINELTATNHEQEHRLGEDEQFLASDRDIRELMGARKLYIADVFDVDSGSRTRKPYGRVFYTQNKSLIFYAFDLDHQAGLKSASIFQVWGQKDAEVGEKPRPMNLGILYMDSESNRRWVLRLDDAKQLAAIDAVFVTVEPHGGSPKPTGKPFLYALLRKEANHP